jgi:Tol biopolymer transport system component
MAAMLCVLALALLQDPADLVDQLGSESLETREKATAALRDLGDRAEKALRARLDDRDPEVAKRCRDLVERLELRRAGRIVAVERRDKTYDLIVMDADGENASVLVQEFSGPGGPAATSDRLQLLCAASRNRRLVVDARTGASRAVAVPDEAFTLAWSADGSRFAYDHSPRAVNPLTVLDATGAKREEVLKMAQRWAIDLRWAPDGKRLFLTTKEFDDQDRKVLRVVDVAAKTMEAVLPGRHTEDLAFSPDGRRLAAYVSDDDLAKSHEVRIVDLATLKSEAVATGKGGAPNDLAAALAWSPDGTRVTFLDQDALCVVTIATKKVARITDGTTVDGSVVWWPDSKRLFYGRDATTISIRTSAADGSDDRLFAEVGRVGDTTPDFRRIEFSADGAWVAFLKDVLDPKAVMHPRSHSEIWVSRPDGDRARKVSGERRIEWAMWVPR